MSALRYWQNENGDGLCIGLVGPMRRGSTTTLRELLAPTTGRDIELDLAGCTDIDLDGAFALAAAEQTLVAAGGTLRLCHVPEPIEDYLRTHHMDHLLTDAQHWADGPGADRGGHRLVTRAPDGGV